MPRVSVTDLVWGSTGANRTEEETHVDAVAVRKQRSESQPSFLLQRDRWKRGAEIVSLPDAPSVEAGIEQGNDVEPLCIFGTC